jgi:hypothetical protein
MRYYYFKPLKPQYFFPEGFEKFPFFLSFYNPYTFAGKISWWLWCNVKILRRFVLCDEIGKYIPEKIITSLVGEKALLAFNSGTIGPEQKVTALGVFLESKEMFFLKYADSPIACQNVQNERNILEQISYLDFVPNLQNFHSSSNYELILTSVLIGHRLSNEPINNELIEILIEISKQDVSGRNMSDSELRLVFGHGDFCPWNLIKVNGQINIYDWEMAGNYPLGYDLFTYIFQTSFLLEPNFPVNRIILGNKIFIDRYFMLLGIENWEIYLYDFAKIKINLEIEKENSTLLKHYKNILNYAH